jgi:hypothetical protein
LAPSLTMCITFCSSLFDLLPASFGSSFANVRSPAQSVVSAGISSAGGQRVGAGCGLRARCVRLSPRRRAGAMWRGGDRGRVHFPHGGQECR